MNTATRFEGAAFEAPRPDDPGLAGVEKVLTQILATLEDAKAEDIVSIPLFERTSLADYMVVASGRSQRHVDAIASHIVNALAKIGKTNVRVEGKPLCDWVLIDEGDVIIHIFRPDVRTFYNLEKLWSPSRPAERSVA